MGKGEWRRGKQRQLLVFELLKLGCHPAHYLPFSTECGSGFTSNLEGMFKDMTISEELTASFKQVTSLCCN